MLSVRGRKPAAVIVEPVAKLFAKAGISPNAVTTIGAAITIAIAVILIPSDHLVAAALLSGLFAAFDMVDGTMARLRGGGTKYGATLDATCDRLTDGALFAAITWWLIYTYDAPKPLVIAAFTVLVCSQVISYVKARAEASGFKVNGGLVERPERLIIGLVGLGLQGFGVPYAIDIALWILALGSIFTVWQRLHMVKQSPKARQVIAPPAGAKEFPGA
ncbi:phosphatidylinositol phosphate synthase [Corynebacterium pelargi]|uniref:Phosphatidylinositol phosphate synthase n=1 Tax=Corynebacterium pelargi TaxID=1471400 RepID=A0A410W8I5_9CORY|nr:CDP-alcohol phosphatidyltransferase family protein [Corynebacterium pelargi]QAU52256.1 CDP-diacylglycerol--inositol 3-phosphatidyltransferase [Corynebacterium pelargi]GGG69040.1 phosphatidylglycerophosphate synthase [Corynebacterium pelargi]